MEAQPYLYDDIVGGLNQGTAAEALADREVTFLQNFYPHGRKLIRRGGTYALTDVAHSEDITAIFSFDAPSVAAPVRVFGTTGGFAKLVGRGIQPIGGTLDGYGNSRPWSMLQYKSHGYAMRRGNGLHYFTPSAFGVAGIAAPGTSPTVAEGAAGVLTAGAYACVVTFVTDDEAESNPCTEVTVVITALKKIDWSNIPTSSNPRVTKRRLYRSLPNQGGAYLRVATLNDNTTTVYEDNVTIHASGQLVSFGNATPPADLRYGDIFQERLFATDGVDVYYSNPFNFEGWDEDSVIRIFPEDGHDITAIHAISDNLLMVGKRNRTYFITPSGSQFQRQDRVFKHGAYHFTVKSAEGITLWFGGDSFYRSAGGGAAENIASIKIKELLENVDPSRYEYAVSAIFPKLGWYVTSIRVEGQDAEDSPRDSVSNNIMLCYNYKQDAWFTFKLPDDSFAYLAELYSDDGELGLYGVTYDGIFYQFNRGRRDMSDAYITGIIRTKAYRWGAPGLLHAIRRVFLSCSNAAAYLTIRLYKNRSETAAKSRSVYLYESDGGENGWKGYGMSTENDLGTTWQAEFEYAGDAELEIEGWGFDTIAHKRRVRIR